MIKNRQAKTRGLIRKSTRTISIYSARGDIADGYTNIGRRRARGSREIATSGGRL